jgi:hypothetical protein
LKIIGDITTDLFACYYRMTWPTWTWDVWHIEQEKGRLLVWLLKSKRKKGKRKKKQKSNFTNDVPE